MSPEQRESSRAARAHEPGCAQAPILDLLLLVLPLHLIDLLPACNVQRTTTHRPRRATLPPLVRSRALSAWRIPTVSPDKDTEAANSTFSPRIRQKRRLCSGHDQCFTTMQINRLALRCEPRGARRDSDHALHQL